MKKSIGRMISILHRQAQVYHNCTLKDLEISSAEYPFLLYLYQRDGASQDELSSYLYIDKAATARSINSLEDKGFVERRKKAEDKRFNHVYLTDKAKDVEKEVRERVWNWSKLLTDGMDETEVEKLMDTLHEMVQKVEKHQGKKKTEE
ncbi:winged helix-turn-helix transcriptional regulator [Alkalibacter rhizosphaerae]|uniref:Winged helix-turn-helix transcriptional regulator n=1 Tax=Alkalibacter rhizosphaerae TaxID=2815577 RepID=A0A975AH07_9FIRM|nr:MarR family winged helix-turn-helix transcriptional regulator [Alkalibacter rhizosphaerae]QSX07942.1 winged helix-turn-helix transcriptional regulator [Alkalibacter rhizosphaerae]